MITNIKSINVFPSWDCCSVHDLDLTKLIRWCCFGRYSLHLCSSNAFFTITESQRRVWLVWADSAYTVPMKLLQPSSVPYISLSYQETLRNSSFSAKHSAPCCLPLIMQMRFSHAGFEVSFRFYTKHMIGSFNFLVWAAGCASAVLMTLLLGIFLKYYTTAPLFPLPPQTKKTKHLKPKNPTC